MTTSIQTAAEKCHRDNCKCGMDHASPTTHRLCSECNNPLTWEKTKRCDDCVEKNATQLINMVRARRRQATGAEQSTPRPTPQLDFPEECIEGDKLGEWARAMHMPLGLAYPAILVCWSVKPDFDLMAGARINLYGGLIAKPEGGKNQAIDRALRMTELAKGRDYQKSNPGGDAQLAGLLGDRKSGKQGATRERIPGPEKLLLVNNEMSDVLRKTGIDDSTLAQRLCDLWDDSEYSKPTGRNGESINVNCRLSWIGGIPADAQHPEKFSELFGVETNFGLYPRFIFGYTDVAWNYRDWEPPTGRTIVSADDDMAQEMARINNNAVTVVHSVSEAAYELLDAWKPAIEGVGRLKYNAKKIAILKACANGEQEVSEKRMRQALMFMDWQVRIRQTFRPSEAKESNREAWFAERLLPALERAGAVDKFVNWRRISLDNRWDTKVDPSVQLRTVKSLCDLGRLYEEESEDGPRRKRRYPKVMLAKAAQ